VFDPFENERMKALTTVTIEADAVGEMVRDAIQRNQLYLNTHPLSDEWIEERRRTIFGADTLGRRRAP
jgi:hypothetical protein